MWGNITGTINNVVQKVQKIQSEIENQMDAAVGNTANPPSSSNSISNTAPVKENDEKINDLPVIENSELKESEVSKSHEEIVNSNSWEDLANVSLTDKVKYKIF